ncbi:hypothetical protein ACG2F4_14110 [Halalkalibaculum sp. DA3122]|uniref:hypothetical protein n=1 Tax=Halalkalibaculum sp. DA3122 TaxID=3373607 RepID=UPI003753F3E8
MSPEIIISAVALVVSIVVAIYSYRQGQKSNELQSRVVKLEEKREERNQKQLSEAKLNIELEKVATGKYIFRIINKGPAKATDFSFRINGQAPHKYDRMLFDLESINQIQSGQKLEKRVSNTKDQGSVIDVVANFEDGNGKQEKEFRLNF